MSIVIRLDRNVMYDTQILYFYDHTRRDIVVGVDITAWHQVNDTMLGHCLREYRDTMQWLLNHRKPTAEPCIMGLAQFHATHCYLTENI